MSAELGDLKRLKITARTLAWLQAEAHSSGRSMHEIAREALDQIAAQKIHAARVLIALAGSEGRDGEPRGTRQSGVQND